MKGSWASALEEDEIAQLYEIQYWLFKVCLKSGQPVRSRLALPRVYQGEGAHPTALGSSAGLAVWDSIFIISSVSLNMYLTACPSPGAWNSGSPPLPILSHPVWLPWKMEQVLLPFLRGSSQPSVKPWRGSRCSGLSVGWGSLRCSTALQGHFWRGD